MISIKRQWVASAISLTAITVLSLLITPQIANAQAYPNKSLKLILAYPPGGATDFIARTLADKLGTKLGQSVVVENKPGGGTLIAAQAFVGAPADGYTLMLADLGTLSLNPSLYKKLPYDVDKQFQPVSMVAKLPLALTVHPNVPAKTMREFLEYAKSKGELNYASPGVGSPHHVAMELLKQKTGLKATHIPYKGAGPAVTDLVAGVIPFMYLDLASGLTHMKADKLRPLAIGGSSRPGALPNLPTLKEAGYGGVEAHAWQGIFVNTGTSKDVVDRLHKELVAIITSDDFKTKLSNMGIDAISSTPAEFSDYIKSETAAWGKVIKDNNISVE